MSYTVDVPNARCSANTDLNVQCVLTEWHKGVHVTPNGNQFLRHRGTVLPRPGERVTGQYIAGLQFQQRAGQDARYRPHRPLAYDDIVNLWNNPFASSRPAPSADSETATFRIQLVDAAGNVKQSHYSVADLLARLAERYHNDAAVTLEQAVRAVEASVSLEQKARERLSAELVWTRQHMTSRMDRLQESSLGQRRGSDAFQRDLITRQQLTDALASRTQADDRTWDVRRQAVVEAMAKRDNVLKEATLVNLQALEKRLADRLDRLDRLLEQTTASDATGPWDATSPEPPRESQYQDAGNFTWTFVDGRWGYQVAGGQWIAVGPWPHLTTGSESSGPLVVADFPWVRV